jgi:hypothetical protein
MQQQSLSLSEKAPRLHSWMVILLALRILLTTLPIVSAWERCSNEQGGGACPNGSECCSSGFEGISASCVPTAHSSLPDAPRTGQCCGDFLTGCPFGYECTGSSVTLQNERSEEDLYYCLPTDETIIADPWARKAPRYHLCRVTPEMQQLHGFPIHPTLPLHEDDGPSPSRRWSTNGSSIKDVFHLGYYSSQGSIAGKNQSQTHHHQVETVVVMIHGSLRDADDYFCTGLSLLNNNNGGNATAAMTTHNNESVLILAPWFASVSDDTASPSAVSSPDDARIPNNLLMWDDAVNAYDSFYWHLWRYGADASNAPISSFAALDRMVEYLVTATENFPNLQQITVVGHSGKRSVCIAAKWIHKNNNSYHHHHIVT